MGLKALDGRVLQRSVGCFSCRCRFTQPVTAAAESLARRAASPTVGERHAASFLTSEQHVGICHHGVLVQAAVLVPERRVEAEWLTSKSVVVANCFTRNDYNGIVSDGSYLSSSTSRYFLQACVLCTCTYSCHNNQGTAVGTRNRQLEVLIPRQGGTRHFTLNGSLTIFRALPGTS